ncbi:MAG: ABC transporter permease [Bacteroidales bacterium]|nr:ABC transporter permease [Bacteroidales bacterium]
MLKHLLKTTLRYFYRQRFIVLINIVGLILGITISIIIFLHLIHEIGFDKEYIKGDNIYNVIRCSERQKDALTLMSLGPQLKETLPEITKMTRLLPWRGSVLLDNTKIKTKILFVDPDFFKMFKRKHDRINTGNLIDDPNSIVISKELGNKLFGSDNPTGQQILISFNDKNFNFMVSSVIEDFGVNSSIKGDIICNFDFYEKNLCDPFFKMYPFYSTYIELTDGVPLDELELKIYKLLGEENPWLTLKYELKKYSKLYLNPESLANYKFPTGNIRLLNVLIIVVLLVLISSAINFGILSTACAISKNKEINIRKIYGASNNQVKYMALFESFLLVIISLPLILILSYFALPVFNSFFDTDLKLFTSDKGLFLIGIAFLVIFISLSGGLNASWFFSKQSSINLSTYLSETKVSGSGIQKLLLLGQMFLFICLVNSSFFIYKQIDYSERVALSSDSDNFLFIGIENPEKIDYNDKKYENFNRLESILKVCVNHPYIIGASYIYDQIPKADLVSTGFIKRRDSDERKSITGISVEKGFPEFMNYKLVAGRHFSNNYAVNEILLNEAAVKYLQLDDPVGNIIEQDGGMAEIVGVVEDFSYQSARKEILPLRIRKNSKFRGEFFLVVKYFESKDNEVINYIGTVLSDRLPGYKIEYSYYKDNVASLYINEKKQLSIISVGIIAAMIIAILGLIAISLFSIRQRVKEFGIRKVNGASVSELLFMVNKSFIKWVIFAFILACPVVYFAISRWLNNFAFKTEISWWVFLIGGFLALFITIVTISIQSYKTTIKNPVEALRYE